VDVNTKDASENTALMVAAALGHMSVLKVILAHPLLNIQAGVRECSYMYLTTDNTSTPDNTMHGYMLISHAGFYRWHCVALCSKCKEEQVCSSPAGGWGRPFHCGLHSLHSPASGCVGWALPVCGDYMLLHCRVDISIGTEA